jgi:hypothetical protein
MWKVHFGRGCRFSCERGRGCRFGFGRGKGAFLLRVMVFERFGCHNLVCIRNRSRFIGALGLRIIRRIVFYDHVIFGIRMRLMRFIVCRGVIVGMSGQVEGRVE